MDSANACQTPGAPRNVVVESVVDLHHRRVPNEMLELIAQTGRNGIRWQHVAKQPWRGDVGHHRATSLHGPSAGGGHPDRPAASYLNCRDVLVALDLCAGRAGPIDQCCSQLTRTTN